LAIQGNNWTATKYTKALFISQVAVDQRQIKVRIQKERRVKRRRKKNTV
jgi:hypothetical protein